MRVAEGQRKARAVCRGHAAVVSWSPHAPRVMSDQLRQARASSGISRQMSGQLVWLRLLVARLVDARALREDTDRDHVGRRGEESA